MMLEPAGLMGLGLGLRSRRRSASNSSCRRLRVRTVFMVAGSKFGSDDGKGGFPHEQQALKSPTEIYGLPAASDDVGAETAPFAGKL